MACGSRTVIQILLDRIHTLQDSPFDHKPEAIKPIDNNDRLVIYTAILGDYDQLRQPRNLLEHCDYVCFSDQPVTDPGVWQIRQPPAFDLDKVRLNRYLKLMPHRVLPEYQKSIYIDGNIEIIGDISALVENSLHEFPIAAYSHPVRKCVYAEARQCVVDGLENPLTVIQQVRRYARCGYPANQGLVEANVLIRHHHEQAVVDLMENWWGEIVNNSRRDQLSFNFVCWRNKSTYQTLGVSNVRTDSKYFRLHPHSHSRTHFLKTWRRKLFRPFRKLFLVLLPNQPQAN